MKNVRLGIIPIIAVAVSGCLSGTGTIEVEVPIEAPKLITCKIPDYLATVPDFPPSPAPLAGRDYPTNQQMDVYFRFDVSNMWVCDTVCAMMDIVNHCADQLVLKNVPAQCLSDGILRCE